MTNITNSSRFTNYRTRTFDRRAAETSDSLSPLIPIGLLTAFMLWAVINPMW